MRTCSVVLVSLGCLVVQGRSLLAESAPTLAELAVDQVTLKHGPRLLGAVFDRTKDGSLTIAVSRAWLKKSQPKYHDACAAEAAVERREALEQLRDRLLEWSQRRTDDTRLEFFLKKQTERVDRALPEKESDTTSPGDGDFLLISLTPAKFQRVFIQPPSRKQVAIVAWREGLTDVEARSARNLEKELQKKGIEPAKERVDLSDRLPTRKQSETEWAARQALVEYEYRKAVDFQGTGELVVRTGEGAKAPAAGELLVGVLKEQISAALSDLQTDSAAVKSKPKSQAWLKSAIDTAEEERACGFRVTRVAPDISGNGASVETRFVARLAADRWETIWRHTETVDSAGAEKDRIERIARDPQIKQVLELIRAAGLGEGEAQLHAALRYGAATMQAQEGADARFAEFRNRYLERLEGPPLPHAEGDN
jgi:hypothetical protein